MRISVCVPTRDRPDMLRELLTVLGSLDVPEGCEVEVLVGDNSTDDRSAAVCAEFPSVSYRRNPPGLGAYDNFNSLLERSTGDWVHLVADDDVVDRGYLSGIAEALHDPQTVIVTGDVRFTGSSAATVAEGHDERLTRMGVVAPTTVSGPALLNASLIHGCPLTFSMVLVRRTAACDIGGFTTDFRLQGDYEFWLRLMARGPVHFGGSAIGTVRAWEENELARSSSASREFRIERTLIRLRALDVHDHLLADEVREVLVAEVRHEMPRVRTYVRTGYSSDTADVLLTGLVRRAQQRLDERGAPQVLDPPLERLLRRPPRPVMAGMLRLADVLRRTVVRIRPDGGDVGERLRTTLGRVDPSSDGGARPRG